MIPRFCGEDKTSHFTPFYERLMAAGWFHVDRTSACAICGFSFGHEWHVSMNDGRGPEVFMRVDLCKNHPLARPERHIVVSFELI